MTKIYCKYLASWISRDGHLVEQVRHRRFPFYECSARKPCQLNFTRRTIGWASPPSQFPVLWVFRSDCANWISCDGHLVEQVRRRSFPFYECSARKPCHCNFPTLLIFCKAKFWDSLIVHGTRWEALTGLYLVWPKREKYFQRVSTCRDMDRSGPWEHSCSIARSISKKNLMSRIVDAQARVVLAIDKEFVIWLQRRINFVQSLK